MLRARTYVGSDLPAQPPAALQNADKLGMLMLFPLEIGDAACQAHSHDVIFPRQGLK